MLDGHGFHEELTDVRLAWILSALSGEAITAEKLRGQPLRYLKPASAATLATPKYPGAEAARALGI